MADALTPLLALPADEAARRLEAAGDIFFFVESVAPRASGPHPDRSGWRVVRASRRAQGIALLIVPAVPLPG